MQEYLLFFIQFECGYCRMKAESLHIYMELTERQRWRGRNLSWSNNTHSSSYDAWAHLAHPQRPQSFLQSLVWKLFRHHQGHHEGPWHTPPAPPVHTSVLRRTLSESQTKKNLKQPHRPSDSQILILSWALHWVGVLMEDASFECHNNSVRLPEVPADALVLGSVGLQ